jgi:hypothetical protein
MEVFSLSRDAFYKCGGTETADEKFSWQQREQLAVSSLMLTVSNLTPD